MSKQGIENGIIKVDAIEGRTGSLGVGTNTPKRQLHIHNPSVNPSAINLTNASTTLGTGLSGLRILIDENGDSFIINGENRKLILGTNSQQNLYIKSNGYVGVSVNDPQYPLDVNGILRVSSGIKGAEDTDNNSVFGRAVVGGCGVVDLASFAHFDSNTSTKYALAQTSLGETYLNAASGQTIRFRINNVDVMKINSNSHVNILNNLGLNVDSPTYKIELNSSQQGLMVFRNGTNYLFEFENNSGDEASLNLRHGGTAKILLRTNGNSYFNGGNIAIGHNSPEAILHVKKDSGRIALQRNSNLSTSHISFSLLNENGVEVGNFGLVAVADQFVGNTSANDVIIRAMGGNLVFGTSTTAGTPPSASAMVIGTNGLVSIGNSSPSTYKLTVQNDVAGNSISQVAHFTNAGSTATSSFIKISSTTGADWRIGKNPNAEGIGGMFGIFKEGGSKSSLTINALNEFVGIGINEAAIRLHVAETFAGDATVLALGNYWTGWNANRGVSMKFFGDGASYNHRDMGKIGCYWTSDNNGGHTYMSFSTRYSEQLYERVRITHDGKVGIGTTNISWRLQIHGIGTENLFLVDGNGTAGTQRIAQIGNGSGTEFCVLANGKVGIGYTDNTDILEKLTLNGSINLCKKVTIQYNSTEGSMDFIFL